MASGQPGIEGKDELLDALARLPVELQRKILKRWTKTHADKVAARAKALAPMGKTGRLRKGVVARQSTARTLRKHNSLARAVVIGKKPAFHFHIVNLGTKKRTTGGGGRRKASGPSLHRAKLAGLGGANRGRMPANPFLSTAAGPVMAEALASASTSLAFEVERALAAALKRTAKRARAA